MKKKIVALLLLTLVLGTFAPFQQSSIYAASATDETSGIDDTVAEDGFEDDLEDIDPALAAEAAILMDYIDQMDKIADYEDKAVDMYNKNRYVTTSNRKSVYAALTYTVVPNYTKFVVGLKKIKPENQELAAIHAKYIKAASLQLQAMTLFKKYAADPKLKVSTLNQANKKIDEGMKMLDSYKKAFTAYMKKFE